MKRKRPQLWRQREVIRQCRALLKKSPDDSSSGYRRGLIEALLWSMGLNPNFEERLRKRTAKGKR